MFLLTAAGSWLGVVGVVATFGAASVADTGLGRAGGYRLLRTVAARLLWSWLLAVLAAASRRERDFRRGYAS